MRKAYRTARTSPVATFLVRRRRAVQAVVDALAWVLALALATWLRFEFEVDHARLTELAVFAPFAAAAQLVAGLAAGLYLGRWRLGSFDEASALARATLVTTGLVFVLDTWVLPHQVVPRSAVIGASAIAFVLMGSTRWLSRALLDRRRRPKMERGAERLLVFGAGEAGFQIVAGLLRDPDSPYLPVALLDDDPGKRHLRWLGVPVCGTRESVADVARSTGARTLLIAVPSASGEVIRELARLAGECGLDVKVLPSVGELFGSVDVSHIRSLTEADLLGRHQIETDIASIAGYLAGRRVLVTGAGGSIGSELCRQIFRFAPAELIMLDRDESALHALQLSIHGRALLDTPDVVLADIRDGDAIRSLFLERRPEVVFHAAALKHLPMLEQYPAEAVKTNVWGTLAVLEAAAAAGVDRFVNISTDKAADPISVLGYSKRIAERLTAHIASTTDGTYLSVRFGNVLGSRGSVLHAFRAQIEAGGPVTVTHPDVTRYFMTVEEAVELVIQAGAIGRGGEVLVLDMGRPVRIDDVARRLASQAERPVEIVYTGLRDGEKLEEDLFGEGEPDERPVHPLISHVLVPPLDADSVESMELSGVSHGRTDLVELCHAVRARRR
jgi:FlaA1/EpsC-like NDP-sugar epimerase